MLFKAIRFKNIISISDETCPMLSKWRNAMLEVVHPREAEDRVSLIVSKLVSKNMRRCDGAYMAWRSSMAKSSIMSVRWTAEPNIVEKSTIMSVCRTEVPNIAEISTIMSRVSE
jgi:hypothetical protein